MTKVYDLLKAPPAGTPAGAAWFADIAELLLNQTTLMVGGVKHRFCEVEFYFQDDAHPDQFTHGDPLQLTCQRWYFHRDEGSYRGGSFKGVDISFGHDKAFGGILIRSIQAEDGTFINGCSLCADHVLKLTGFPKIAELDAAIADRAVFDTDSPFHIVHTPDIPHNESWATARVGLTLKRARRLTEMPRYLMSPYRVLTHARQVKKGRLHHIIALIKMGLDTAAINALTGTPKGNINRYRESYEAGLEKDSFDPYIGRSLKTPDLCAIHGTWERVFGGA